MAHVLFIYFVIPQTRDPLSYFSSKPVLHDSCNKDRSMCYPVCGLGRIKEPLLLIERVSHVVGATGFVSHYVVLYHNMSDVI